MAIIISAAKYLSCNYIPINDLHCNYRLQKQYTCISIIQCKYEYSDMNKTSAVVDLYQ